MQILQIILFLESHLCMLNKELHGTGANYVGVSTFICHAVAFR